MCRHRTDPNSPSVVRPLTSASLASSPVVWWGAVALLLSALYLVVYVLLRTSADDRPWHQRLRRPSTPVTSADPGDPGSAPVDPGAAPDEPC